MKLNEKVLFFILIFFMFTISVILVLGSSLYLEGYEKLDEQQTVSHLNNAVQALNTSRNNELRILVDWAPWDDTYDYINNPVRLSYIERNLPVETFDNLKINLFVISDLNGTIVWGRTFSKADAVLEPLSPEVLSQVQTINGKISGSRADETDSGIVMFSTGPMMIGTAPVVHTDGSGPAIGRLMLGSSIDMEYIQQIAAVSSPTVTLLPVGDGRIPDAVNSRLLNDPALHTATIPENETSIRGYVLLNDIYGSPVLIVTTQEPRTFYRQGLSSLINGIFVLLCISAVGGSLTVILVDRYVLRRLRLLRDAADEIRTSGTLSGQVDVGGNDELTDVAVAFNQMIQKLWEGQKNLESSERRFHDLADLLPQIIFEMDREGALTYFNKFALDIFGIAEADLASGISAYSFIHPLDRERAKENLRLILERKRATGEVYRLVKRDGSIMTAIIYAGPIIREGVFHGFRGSVNDISELKEMEHALRESEEKYRNLTENTADILFTLDTAGSITYLSPQVTRYGYTPEELVGQPFFLLIHPEDHPGVLKNFSDEMAAGKSISSIFRITSKPGSFFWIEERSNIMYDEKGRPSGMQGVLRDITDRKKAEDAIALANKKLNLLNDITRHDIINTMTGLLGTVDMALDPAMQENRTALLADIRQLAVNVQNQIEFTREYQAVGVKEPVWQNVSEIIKRAADPYTGSAVTIVNDISSFEVFADPLLEKVFYNLIQNAISYGKQITTIRFSEQISDRGFAIVCEDDGTGVPPGMKDQIFGRGIGQHTGMGLFLSREILGITGITIKENGVFGNGARFEMVIPKGGYRFG